MKVTMRKKRLKDGRVALYLDIYKGSVVIDGKVKSVREYEKLDIYLYEPPRTYAQRQYNKEKLRLAETIRARRELDLISGKYQIVAKHKQNFNLIGYVENYSRSKSDNYRRLFNILIANFKEFIGDETIPFRELTPELLQRFIDYLRGKGLSQNTIYTYYTLLKSVLNNAVREGIIPSNPVSDITPPRHLTTKREFLTIDEIRTLEKTPCKSEELKRMFLFSCLTGLRWSDIVRLRWGDVQQNEQNLVIRQQKTKEVEYVYLTEKALELLGETGKRNEYIFSIRRYDATINRIIGNWVKQAGITKKITFHSARHTFAVIQLMLGTDIYTVSKLLGHKKLETTQIYAKIIDQKKREAIEKMSEVL